MSRSRAKVHFEQDGSELKAIEVVRSGHSPVIVPLYRVLLGLGIVISTYQARPSTGTLVERMVLQRSDGGSIGARLSEETKAAILPLVLEDESTESRYA